MAALRRVAGASLATRLQPMDDAIAMLDFERALCLCNEQMQAQPA